MSKSGFSTLNRWLGKKSKDKANVPNGKLSKSSTNLSISSTNINDPSQVEYNRIAPLPAITSNAPFEQTFRITVLLPKDQLYVARLGARVPLSKLLELVCDHKSLDAQKYEFRNPVDPSQIYNCDLTIGSVGLCEIRLCHKSDSYDSYNSDELMKLQRASLIRDSLSSSEFSSRHSKHTTKTASPYSSSNSLNSMDSTGINYTRSPISAPPALPQSIPPQRIAAPPRKKRAAPRPPSQIVIPEKDALVTEQGVSETEQTIKTLKEQQESMGATTIRSEHYASTPNLTVGDINGNNSSSPSENTETISNFKLDNDKPMHVAQKNARNIHSLSVQNLSEKSTLESPDEEATKKLPEPSPRKRLMQIKKKSAPAPPPRSIFVSGNDDAISITSKTTSTANTPSKVDAEAITTFFQEPITNGDHNIETTSLSSCAQFTTSSNNPLQSSTPVLANTSTEASPETSEILSPNSLPKPSPRQTTTTLLNASSPPASPTPVVLPGVNISKVLLNRTPTPEPRSLSYEAMEPLTNAHCDDDNDSKKADSGIGEPIPSPIPDSLPSEGSAHEFKTTCESSSDDDEMIKTYNFKLGKTTVKTVTEEHQKEIFDGFTTVQADSEEVTPDVLTQEPTPNEAETTSWNFTVPISPPPNFADNSNAAFTDAPITPKIVERPVLNFDSLATTSNKQETTPVEEPFDVTDCSKLKEKTTFEYFTPKTPLPSPSSPINEIIDELSTILNEKRVDTLIKKHEDDTTIESAKPNTLTNFSITALTSQKGTSRTVEAFSTKEISLQGVDTGAKPISPVVNDEKSYKKRGNITSANVALMQQLKSISRADSFHTSRQNSEETSNGLNSRSASYLSLTKLEQNGSFGQRRSSSELSIGESPSLQSLEVIKTILNSRKNSLATSSDGESNKSPSLEVYSIEGKSDKTIASVELKPKQSETVVHRESALVTEKPKAEKSPKLYQYSGPPSINFSTWNERPKVEVAIKNEGDYIFGGKNANTQSNVVAHVDVEMRKAATVPRSQRATMPASLPPAVAPKPTVASTIERMGIPEKEYHVPLTVRPLMDVAVETSVSALEKRTSAKNTTKAHSPIDITQLNQVSSVSTLPRSGNRFSMPSQQLHTAPGPSLLRSTSITQFEAQQRSSKSTKTESESVTTAAAPFGQNTLRKTGLKEKILAKDELRQEQQQQQQKIIVNQPNSTKQASSHANTIGLTTSTKLKTTTQVSCPSVSLTHSGHKMPFQNKSKILESAKLELQLHPEFGQKLGSNASTPQSASATPPAPPMPALKSLLRSQSAGVATSPQTVDSRDALLAAIRNFKRNGLNKV